MGLTGHLSNIPKSVHCYGYTHTIPLGSFVSWLFLTRKGPDQTGGWGISFEQILKALGKGTSRGNLVEIHAISPEDLLILLAELLKFEIWHF